nr:basement membrane-specific heparan sulfate proteoglycan core protein-like [Misgurnus anguillicaudatus]
MWDVSLTLTVQPQTSVFIGDKVTLTCEIHQSTGWEFIFTTPLNTESTETTGTKTIRSVEISDGGEYWCRAGRGNPQVYTQYSEPITVTVQERPTPEVFVWPADHVFRGETVNLTCVINGGGVSSWQYSWYKDDSDIQQNKLQYYTIRSVTESDAGKYTCRGNETRGSRYSHISNAVTLTVSVFFSGVSPSVSLIIRPNRSQHFSSESLSLSCEDHSNSTGWTVRRYTDKLKTCSSSDWRSTGTTSTCTIRSLITSDTGVYWCHSESGEKLHPVNISVHNVDVILDSPVHPVTEGDNLTLRCLYRDKKPSNLRAEFYKDGSVVQNQTTGDMMIIHTVSKSHEGFYYCKHPERGESPKSWISLTDVKPILTVQPQTSVFIGDSVTLICEVHQSTGWEFIFINPSNTESTETTGTKTIRYVRVSDGGEYKCRAGRGNPQVYTQYSQPITVTVQERPTPQVSVWPDYLLFRGETVTLTCVINGGGVSSWQYSWYKDSIIQQNKLQYYTIRSVTESDAGKYTCKGTETRGSRYSHISNEVTLTVSVLALNRTISFKSVSYINLSLIKMIFFSGVSPSVSLIIRPNRSQHFSSESLSLSCEDHSNSTGWTVRRYTDKLKPCSSSDWRSTETTSTCIIRSLITSDTGVYWCQSESGEKLHPVNISVHNVDVILDSPVHSVTEGDNLTLRCLYRDKKPSNLRAEFYKDGSVVQNQTTGDMMIIPTVSKSHEGFYYCKHPERGESPKSWISVRGVYQVMSGLKILSFLLAVCPYLLSTVVLVIKCCRLRGESSV